jgi:hypothetical protein
MNTSALSARIGRQGLKTVVEAMLQRVGSFLGKLRTISDRVGAPTAVFSREVVHLPRGMVLSLDQAGGITCLELSSGVVWVTGTPARGDTILRPGEPYEFGDQWPYVIEALVDAEFVASGPQVTRRPRTSAAI